MWLQNFAQNASLTLWLKKKIKTMEEWWFLFDIISLMQIRHDLRWVGG